jgi:hypothetical protein
MSLPAPVGDRALVVPSGRSWDTIVRFLHALANIRIVEAGADAEGIEFNADFSEAILRIKGVPEEVKGLGLVDIVASNGTFSVPGKLIGPGSGGEDTGGPTEGSWQTITYCDDEDEEVTKQFWVRDVPE